MFEIEGELLKSLLVGNGINIQFDSENYSFQQIVLRILKNFDREDFPKHIIVNYPYLMGNYIGRLYLESRKIINGEYDTFTVCKAEVNSLKAFKVRYADKIASLRITDICFEDYYLIHDLLCHKYKIYNPDQFNVRESMRIAYLFSIYNDGKINTLYTLYPQKFKDYLSNFDYIFTTNYDSNIELATGSTVLHIHGRFDKLADVYDETSFRNKLPDCPIRGIDFDDSYRYLYSNALSTHCGEYKEYQINQGGLANSAIENMSEAYKNNPKVKDEVDSWTKNSNTLTSNLGYAIQLKSQHPELIFSDDYHFDVLKKTSGDLEILGLSPWNDLHIFEAVDNANVSSCTFYYFSEEECNKIQKVLPNLSNQDRIHFVSVKNFWGEQYEK